MTCQEPMICMEPTTCRCNSLQGTIPGCCQGHPGGRGESNEAHMAGSCEPSRPKPGISSRPAEVSNKT
eukprot:1161971-Pelagomonas_calceolata.AAC.7